MIKQYMYFICILVNICILLTPVACMLLFYLKCCNHPKEVISHTGNFNVFIVYPTNNPSISKIAVELSDVFCSERNYLT